MNPEFWTYNIETKGIGPINTLFVKKLRARGISDEDIQIVLLELGRICFHCFDNSPGCHCMKDD